MEKETGLIYLEAHDHSANLFLAFSAPDGSIKEIELNGVPKYDHLELIKFLEEAQEARREALAFPGDCGKTPDWMI